jgi:hypothetical protein
MQRKLLVIVLSATFACVSAQAKVINCPCDDMVDVIRVARQYLDSRHIDLSHRFFLSSVEYKNLHSEFERPYWLLSWALLAGTSEGQLYVCVFNGGEITVSCADPRFCPPGV